VAKRLGSDWIVQHMCRVQVFQVCSKLLIGVNISLSVNNRRKSWGLGAIELIEASGLLPESRSATVAQGLLSEAGTW
jgi:hypothetical protein